MEVKEYLKNFNKHSEYVSYTASTEYVTPNVSLCLHPFEVHYGKESPIPPVEPIYQWVEDGFMCDNFDKYVQEKKQVSYDEGTTWQDTGETRKGALIEEKSADCGYIPPTPKNYLTFVAVDNCQFKFSGNGITYSVDDGETWNTLNYAELSPVVPAGSKIMWKGTLTTTARSGIGTFAGTGRYEVEGNPMSLIYGDDFEGQTSLASTERAFAYLFERDANLINAENLVLPATVLSRQAYYYMFSYCTALTKAPKELPATELGNMCYYNMFAHCTSLTDIPSVLPATTLKESCYAAMFAWCSNITTAPELPATTLVNLCYNGMFNYCTKLNYIKAMFTTTPSDSYTSNWVNGVASTGTFVKNRAASWSVTGTNGIPEGWTVQTATA